MVMLATSADEWIKEIKRKEPLELGPVDKRTLRDMMRRPEMMELWRQVVEQIDARRDRLQQLNMLVQEDAAEGLRIQGEHRALVVLVETMLETIHAA